MNLRMHRVANPAWGEYRRADKSYTKELEITKKFYWFYIIFEKRHTSPINIR